MSGTFFSRTEKTVDPSDKDAVDAFIDKTLKTSDMGPNTKALIESDAFRQVVQDFLGFQRQDKISEAFECLVRVGKAINVSSERDAVVEKLKQLEPAHCTSSASRP